MGSGQRSFAAALSPCRLGKEILVTVIVGEIVSRADRAAQRLAVRNLLQSQQGHTYALVAGVVVAVERDLRAGITAGVDFRAVDNGVTLRVEHLRLIVALGVDVPAVRIGRVVGAAFVTVVQRKVDVLQRGDRLARAAQLVLTILVGGLDG